MRFQRRGTLGVSALLAAVCGIAAAPSGPTGPASPAAPLEERAAAAAKAHDLAGAVALYREAAEARKKESDWSGAADDLERLGRLAAARNPEEGEAAWRECLALRQRVAPGSLAEGVAWNGVGAVAFEQGDLDRAEKCYARALEIDRAIDRESIPVGSVLGNLGRVYHLRGNLDRAESFYRQSLVILEKRHAPGPVLAYTINALGVLSKWRGDWDGAEAYYRRALAIFEKSDPDGSAVAGMHMNLGNVAQERGDYPAAEAEERQALAIQQKLAPDSLDVASSLTNLGALATLSKRYGEAREDLERALAIKEKLAPGRLPVASTIEDLGDLALAQADAAKAESYYRQSLAIRAQLAPGSADEAQSRHSLGKALLAEHRGDAAEREFRGAISAIESQGRHLGGADETRAEFGATSIAYYRDEVSLLHDLGRDEEAFAALERSRARELLAMLARRELHLDASVPEELDRKVQAVGRSYDQVERRLASLDPERQAGEVQRLTGRLLELRTEREAVLAKIWDSSPRLRDLENPRTLTLAEARKSLDPGTVLLEYSVGSGRTLLFAVQGGAGGQWRVYPIAIPSARLSDEVATFRNLIRQEGRDAGVTAAREEEGRRLFELLVAPARKLVAGRRRVLLCPDGPLQTLPFGALADRRGTADVFFAEWRPIHAAVSATVAAEVSRRPVRTSEEGHVMLAVGAPLPARPEGEASPSAGAATPFLPVAERARSLPPLPASREEADEVAAIFAPNAELLLGAQATESDVLREAPRARWIHFACHALLDSRLPLDSALVLSEPDPASADSGNGLLQAWEIYEKLHLRADLVTLSACDTALGRESGGEGLIGLVRAFQYAGARSVLGSLWSVSDSSTPALMTAFYRGIRKGIPMDEALRRAQAERIGRGGRLSRPFYWAGFELQGGWR